MSHIAGVAEIVRSQGVSLLRAADQVDAVTEACTRALRPHLLRVRGRNGRLAARLDHLRTPLALSRLRYGADVAISEVAPEQEEFILTLSVAGRARFDYGGATATLEPGAMSVVGPYQQFTLDVGRDFDQVLLRLDRKRVERAAGRLAGTVDATPVHFALTAARVSSGLVGLIDAASRIAADAQLEQRKRLAPQLEALVTDALLLGYPSNLSDRLNETRSISSRRVARAMDYMIANISELFPLSHVAQHCGVTLRSLQAGFRREIGLSPSEWLRNQRLELAYRLLSTANETETTVTAVAAASGFLHPGDFAARFKQKFGASPSSVLRSSPR